MIWYSYTLQNDHHNKSSFPLSPYKVTSIQYNVTDYSHHAIHYNPMAYFITESLCLGPLHPSNTPPLWQSSCYSLYYEFAFFLVQIAYVSEIIWYLSLSDISFSIIPSRPIHFLQMAAFHFFFMVEQISIICIYCIFFIRSSTDGHLV